MEELLNLLKTFPKVGAPTIAIVSGSLGWTLRNVFQIISDNYKYKKELKTFFWKEKINAGKKASEFYLEYMNFLNLGSKQFEMYELGKIEHTVLMENIQNEVKFYMEKLKSFPHFEHHHINIFYEFDEEKTTEISNEIDNNLRQITETKFEESDTNEETEMKITETTKHFKKLKENYAELFLIHKKYLKTVRSDIKEYL